PDDVSRDGAGATCRACHPAAGAPRAPRRKRREIPLPRHFSVQDDGSRLRIRFRWIWHRFTGPAQMCLLWNCFVVVWYWIVLRTAGPQRWLALIIPIPHTAVGLLLVYATLAGLLNRTVIEVTSESLTVRQGPLPWWGNRTLPTDELDRLDCDRDSS